jgi:hypothetical protein
MKILELFIKNSKNHVYVNVDHIVSVIKSYNENSATVYMSNGQKYNVTNYTDIINFKK